MNKIAFFTGARSEYGVMKSLIQRINESSNIESLIIVSGMHLVKSFGYTVEEIENDGFNVSKKIFSHKEDTAPGADEFAIIVREICEYLEDSMPEVMFLIGDRPESYAAALGAHFSKVPIIHFGGGTVTEGALDNIYRYNISNLSSFHFSTSIKNYERLCELPILNKENIFFTGSFAIDAILKFKENVKPINLYIPELSNNEFVLMTFHSATVSDDNIGLVMEESIKFILAQNIKILVTYPNSDPGYKVIIEVINKYKEEEGVVVIKHLGATRYYAALNDSLFVIGNSSSGLIEAPYFHKNVINIGDRQKGREMDVGVIDLPCEEEAVIEVLKNGFSNGWRAIENNQIYGDGNALDKAVHIIKTKILTND